MDKRHFTLAVLTTLLAGVPMAHAKEQPFDSSVLESRLEQATPAGRVPPPSSQPGATALPDEQPYITETAPQSDEASGATLAEFGAAYRQARSPRLAIYFNRELSDEIREWIPVQRQQVTLQSTQSAAGYSQGEGQFAAHETATLQMESTAELHHGASGKREDHSEAWKWRFEDAITRLFLEANAKVVDRSVILRQMARQSPSADSTSLNEISALDRYADILVETSVTRSGAEPGYDFRATAKDIRTGRILGTALVNGSEVEGVRKSRFVATSKGYERQAESPEMTVEGISRALTLKLMRSLSQQLGNRS
jgi:hypothetical protein